MQQRKLGNVIPASAIALGFWRVDNTTVQDVTTLVHTAAENGITLLDTADIYGQGVSETMLGQALQDAKMRNQFILQTKCGIQFGQYNFSKEHIIESVEDSLKRLQTDVIDVLLLHRPDALVEPEEVAEAFMQLNQQGKVRSFGVSNHRPLQIALLQKYLPFRLLVNQMQFSLTNASMLDTGLHTNMEVDAALDRDGDILDYCRLQDITIQAWSPLQYGVFQGTFLGRDDLYPDLNEALADLAEEKGVTKAAIAFAWILRHPAKMQVIAGTTNPTHLAEVCRASEVTISREEWYQLYAAAGNRLP